MKFHMKRVQTTKVHRKQLQELRFGQYTKDNRFMVLHVVGGVRKGQANSIIEGLTAKQARNIVKRLENDLDRLEA